MKHLVSRVSFFDVCSFIYRGPLFETIVTHPAVYATTSRAPLPRPLTYLTVAILVHVPLDRFFILTSAVLVQRIYAVKDVNYRLRGSCEFICLNFPRGFIRLNFRRNEFGWF